MDEFTHFVMGDFPSDDFRNDWPPRGRYLIIECGHASIADGVAEALTVAYRHFRVRFMGGHWGQTSIATILGSRLKTEKAVQDHRVLREVVQEAARLAGQAGGQPKNDRANERSDAPAVRIRQPAIAARQYQEAADAMGGQPGDREAYEWLKKKHGQSGEAVDLPTFETWARNLRTHRHRTGTSKSSSRRERHGRSITPKDGI